MMVVSIWHRLFVRLFDNRLYCNRGFFFLKNIFYHFFLSFTFKRPPTTTLSKIIVANRNRNESQPLASFLFCFEASMKKCISRQCTYICLCNVMYANKIAKFTQNHWTCCFNFLLSDYKVIRFRLVSILLWRQSADVVFENATHTWHN